MFGIKAVIAMPADAPAMKVGNVMKMGAEVVPFDRFRDDRMTVVRPYMERGMVLVPPFDGSGHHRRPGHDRPRIDGAGEKRLASALTRS